MDFSLQFLNTASWMTNARETLAGSTQFFFAQNPEQIYENPYINIGTIVSPLIDRWTDIIAFSEIFGTKQRDVVKKFLEARWYKVFTTSAFEMWSQSVDEEHLYNVIWVKPHLEQWLRDINHKKFHNNRPVSWIGIAWKYLWNGEGEWDRWRVAQALHLHNRLARGILDGAISLLSFDNFTLATWHVHKFNDEVRSVLWKKIQEERKPFILVWDMNVVHGKDILIQPPFNTPDFRSLLFAGDRTFGLRKGGSPFDRLIHHIVHRQPDVLIARWVNSLATSLIDGPSDHRWIDTKLRVA